MVMQFRTGSKQKKRFKKIIKLNKQTQTVQLAFLKIVNKDLHFKVLILKIKFLRKIYHETISF
jgi:hypothetical protein